MELCPNGGFSDAIFYKWRAKFGGMQVSEAQRLRELESENAKLVDIANVRRRFCYGRIHYLLRTQFPSVNHKRVYRLNRQANLAVRQRKKSNRPINKRVPLQLARTVNEVWSMDL